MLFNETKKEVKRLKKPLKTKNKFVFCVIIMNKNNL